MTQPESIDVLVVEDSTSERELTLRALEQSASEARVAVVEDGEQALDFLWARGAYRDRETAALPRLVLLDLKLPKLDGLEVIRQLRDEEATKTVPIVMLTSSHDSKDIAESYASGVNGYMVKPMDFDEFVRCVSKVGDYWLTCNRVPR